MSNEEIKTVTDAELRSLGVYPESPMSSPRHKDWPIRVRHGDNLIERSRYGCINVSIGYFTPSQVLARKVFGEMMQRAFDEAMQR